MKWAELNVGVGGITARRCVCLLFAVQSATAAGMIHCANPPTVPSRRHPIVNITTVSNYAVRPIDTSRGGTFTGRLDISHQQTLTVHDNLSVTVNVC